MLLPWKRLLPLSRRLAGGLGRSGIKNLRTSGWECRSIPPWIPLWYLLQTTAAQAELGLTTPLHENYSEGHGNSFALDYPWLQSPDQPFYPNLSGSVTYSDRTDVNVNPPNVSFSRVGETGESSKNDTAFVGQKCQYPNCPETRIFKQDSVFKKHMDKHLRPYKCPIPTCTVTPFATPGDLKRHEREVHSTPTFTCPITSCRRHRRGFGRKDNLVQHLQRVHDQEVDGMTSSSPPALNLDGGFSNKDSFTGLGRVISNSNTTSTDLLITSMSSPSEKTTLMAKLQQLEMEKVKAMAKFDGDIAALKRVLSFM